jgi:hypothetical protein
MRLSKVSKLFLARLLIGFDGKSRAGVWRGECPKALIFLSPFCSIFFYFRNSSELTTEFPDTPIANQIVFSLKFETETLRKRLTEIKKKIDLC